MQWTSVTDLREKYLSFFESKGHLRLPSFSLVPEGDKSLLLINAGMAPLKKYFTGEAEPPRHRVTTCQKCMRMLDIDSVGITARHGTFFEMLGNFSFGDYFKNEAIPWAWEFLTDVLGMPEELLYPSVYEEDDEAFDIWNKKVGVPAERITRLGKEDNFWEHGSGPCGPCSEIYFDRGEKYGCGRPDCRPGCDCDRFMEVWNNVFTQFNSDGNGHYAELAKKNIDTGMGLERLACVMQGVDNMFEIDSIRKILDHVVALSGKKYGEVHKYDVSIRVITDHIRGTVFLISDGVSPSNEGRGYVLRRLMRRAVAHGKLLGIDRPFLTELAGTVIAENGAGYPELIEKQEYIKKVISVEEERFNATIDAGLSKLASVVADVRKSGGTVVSGEDAFRLYDTFGFPLDMTVDGAKDAGLTVDEERFRELMKEQKARARAARGSISGWSAASMTALENIGKTEFTGYGEYETASSVIALLTDGETVSSVTEGECTVILDRSPFYGEMGGQVGDSGVITADGCRLTVTDTKIREGIILHVCSLDEGIVRVGDRVTAKIDGARRDAIKRNHSSCHLLQAALRRVLGDHVAQAGSYVDENRVRFDFTHFSAMTEEEIARTEALVNDAILSALPVSTVECGVDEAKKMGATALFGEKYGDVVRVVSMGDFSMELCGGTHVENVSRIGLFKIVSESSVAAGVRRIEGVTGYGVLSLLGERDALIAESARALKVNNPADIPGRAVSLHEELVSARREAEALRAKLAGGRADSLLASAKPLGAVRLITADLGAERMDAVRSLGDSLRDRDPAIVAVFAIHADGKLNFTAVCGADAVAAGAHAGNLLREVSAITGGRGGGRPDSAASGGQDISKIGEALAAAEGILSGMLK
ncbi:MAG: alanine--tRNA ligase [Clostridia bacterium]|nr:alanine--tRNA ligase [Clostridia bacterium]